MGHARSALMAWRAASVLFCQLVNTAGSGLLARRAKRACASCIICPSCHCAAGGRHCSKPQISSIVPRVLCPQEGHAGLAMTLKKRQRIAAPRDAPVMHSTFP
jgi:hypothetical protein